MDLQLYVKCKYASYPVSKATTNIYTTPLLSGSSNTTYCPTLAIHYFVTPTSGCHTKLLLFQSKYRPYHDSLEVYKLAEFLKQQKSHTYFLVGFYHSFQGNSFHWLLWVRDSQSLLRVECFPCFANDGKNKRWKKGCLTQQRRG